MNVKRYLEYQREYQRKAYRRKKGLPEDDNTDFRKLCKHKSGNHSFPKVKIEGITLVELAKRYDIKYNTMYVFYKRHKGWTLEQIENHFNKGEKENG